MGVVVEGVEGVCKFQHSLAADQGKAANHFGQGYAGQIQVLSNDPQKEKGMKSCSCGRAQRRCHVNYLLRTKWLRFGNFCM